MVDSAFYSPGSGGGASNLNDLTDVTLNDVDINQIILTNQNNDWVNQNPDAIRLLNQTANGWYYPKGLTRNEGNYWDPGFTTAAPIAFTKYFWLTDWAVFISPNDWPGSGDFADNGGKIHASIYKSTNQGIPTDFHADLGIIEVSNINPGGYGVTPFIKSLAQGVLLNPNETYYIAIRKAINDGEGGYTNGQGPGVRQLISSGTNETLNQLPVGDNNLGWSGGEKAGFYLDAFYSEAFGDYPATLGGFYPNVSWAEATIILQSDATNFALKGNID